MIFLAVARSLLIADTSQADRCTGGKSSRRPNMSARAASPKRGEGEVARSSPFASKRFQWERVINPWGGLRWPERQKPHDATPNGRNAIEVVDGP